MKGRETLRRLLRAVAAPGAAPGAAERIADAAWERAAVLRRESAAGAGLRFRRRAVSIAAAAAILAAVVIAVRGSEPAFAVDGDSVQVQHDGAWETARRVPVGSWVFVPRGARTTVRGADGSLVAPRPGALFRILAAAPRHAWRVELRSGDAEVSGATISLRMSDAVDVARAETDDVLRVVASLGAGLDTAPQCIDEARPGDDDTQWVHSLGGLARVIDLRGTDVLLLRPSESAVRFTLGSPGAQRTWLARETAWNADVPADVFRGERVVGAFMRGTGGMTIALQSRDAGVRGISISGELRVEAMNQLALVATEQAAFALEFRATTTGATTSAAEYEHAEGDRHTRIVVRADGTARLERAGEPAQEFASVAALRASAPAAAALFGDKLR